MEQNAACAWQLHNGTPIPKERTSRYCSIPLLMQSISPAPRQGCDDLKAGAVWFTGCHHEVKTIAFPKIPKLAAEGETGLSKEPAIRRYARWRLNWQGEGAVKLGEPFPAGHLECDIGRIDVA